MKKIQMVDLLGQYNKIREEVDNAILNVVSSSAYIKGPAVKNFEENLAKYLGVKHVISCGNGTDALQVSMMALGFKPGDEIITVSHTYVATAEVMLLLGLIPVYVDIDQDSFNMDVSQIEQKITDKTVAIVPVHIYGQSVNMEDVLKIAKKYNLRVIEDNAQAIGADYTFSDGKKIKTGSIGDIGCTSFYPSKNLGGMGDGGAIFTNDDKIADILRQVANHGQSSLYDFEMVGVNSRLDSIQAAILDIKLKYLDNYIKARQKVASFYDNAFGEHPKLKIPIRSSNSTHVFHQYTLTLDGINRDELKKYLAEKGIPTMIYYPKPLHFYKPYKGSKNQNEDLRITETLSNKIISLPMHTEMEDDQLQYIVEHVLNFVNN